MENEMSAKWILFLILISANGNPATSTVEFDSEAGCKEARLKIETRLDQIQKIGRKIEKLQGEKISPNFNVYHYMSICVRN